MNQAHSAVDPCLDTNNFFHLLYGFRDRGGYELPGAVWQTYLEKEKEKQETVTVKSITH